MLNEREFELINTIASEISLNQRDLSRKMDISLGMVNMIIRRLITKGYIRTSKMKAKRIGYMLTPKGISEKMNQSMRYTMRTIKSISMIKQQLKQLLNDLYNSGERCFFILGETDLASLAEMASKESGLKDCTVTHMKNLPGEVVDGTVLVCEEDVFDQVSVDKKIDVIHELAKGHDVLERQSS